MCKSSLPLGLIIIGLVGCLNTQSKPRLKRPEFSKPAPVTSSTAPIQTKSCGGKCCGTEKTPTPATPEPNKKIVGELPEYQDEDDGTF